MLTTNQKGAIAETAIAHASTKLLIEVYKPISDRQRFDLLFDLGCRVLRVQCKWASRYGDAIWVRCYSSRRTPAGVIRRVYRESEVDAIAAYCGDTGRCYLLPVELFDGRAQVHLRLAPSRNNQRRRVHWASDYEFDSLDWEGIAGP